jgi:hypothetical protein
MGAQMPPADSYLQTLDLVATFPLFRPYSSGNRASLATCTVDSINQTIPNLAKLARTLAELDIGRQTIPANVMPVRDFAKSTDCQISASRIKELFDKYGSDKSSVHNYHWVYGTILSEGSSARVLEVGIGSHHSDVVSNMGPDGKPGASLRAFRSFTGGAIYGADIDTRVIFSEEGIKTFPLDQNDAHSFERLDLNVPDNLDLVIDDGLHAPNANLATLNFGLKKVRCGGWVVIEDIRRSSLALWEVVSYLMPTSFPCFLLEDDVGAIMFVVQKGGSAL